MEAKAMPWEAAFRHNLIQQRAGAGISQTELAKRLAAKGLPFHQQTIQRIEAGDRPVRLNEAMIISALFNIDLDEMITPTSPEALTEAMRSSGDHAVALMQDIDLRLSLGRDDLIAQADGLERSVKTYTAEIELLGKKPDGGLLEETTTLVASLRAYAERITTVITS